MNQKIGLGIGLGLLVVVLGLTVLFWLNPDLIVSKKIVDGKGVLIEARFIEDGEVQVTLVQGLNATTYRVYGEDRLNIGETYRVWHYDTINAKPPFLYIEKVNP